LVNYWDKYTEMHGQQNVKIILKLSSPYILCRFLLATIQDTSQAQGESAPGISYVRNINVLTVFLTRNLRV